MGNAPSGRRQEIRGHGTGDGRTYNTNVHRHPVIQKAFTAHYGHHSCDVCDRGIVGVGYRCAGGCDFDLCARCFGPVPQPVPQPMAVHQPMQQPVQMMQPAYAPQMMQQQQPGGYMQQPGGYGGYAPQGQMQQPAVAQAMPYGAQPFQQQPPVAHAVVAQPMVGQPQRQQYAMAQPVQMPQAGSVAKAAAPMVAPVMPSYGGGGPSTLSSQMQTPMPTQTPTPTQTSMQQTSHVQGFNPCGSIRAASTTSEIMTALRLTQDFLQKGGSVDRNELTTTAQQWMKAHSGYWTGDVAQQFGAVMAAVR